MQLRLVVFLSGSFDELKGVIDRSQTLIVTLQAGQSGCDKRRTTIVRKLGAGGFHLRLIVPDSRDAAVVVARNRICPSEINFAERAADRIARLGRQCQPGFGPLAHFSRVAAQLMKGAGESV